MPVCSQCGAPLEQNATACKYCGEPVSVQSESQQAAPQQAAAPQPQPQVVYQQPPIIQQPIYMPNAAMINEGINPAWPIKNKVAAGLLAIFFGGLGIHKFYLGRIGAGIVYLIFCWTFIPAFVGFIEGIIYLTSSDHNFQVKNQVRVS